MHNVVYFSGSHGSGKSTLIKKISEKDTKLFKVYEKLKIPKSEDPLERQKLRLVRYYWDALNQQKFSKENPDKILLCDRDVSSSYAYTKTLTQLGWMTQKQYEECAYLREELFDDSIKPKNIAFLNLSLEELEKNIRKRWKETGKKKWREDNFQYLGLVKINFEEFYKEYEANMLEIDFLDLEKRIKTCYDWITKTIKRNER
ncbi:MAG: deoxynucleoside kinase [Nanoarchaeota archaeon]|nr:deoxynucleoside kinase [Nanoarchaeota archaeon]